MAEELGKLGEQIERLVVDAAVAKMSNADREPDGYYYLQQPKADAELILARPKWHGETLESPLEMEKFIADRLEKDFLKGDPAIFYGETAVVLAYDLVSRRDFARCTLQPSSQWMALVQNANKPMPQKDFIRLLRVTYRGCLADGNLVSTLRNIKWNNSDAGESAVQHGRESMGRQIIAQVQGIDVIPEEITLTIPVFENHAFRTRIQCAVDVNAEARTFSLTPFPQEMHNAMESTLDDILIGLTKANFPPAFRGTV